MFFLKTQEREKIIKFYNKVPSFFDAQNSILYFLETPIALPPMNMYERKLTIFSGIFYKNATVLVFKNNGKKNCLEIKKEDWKFSDIGFENSPILKFSSEEEVMQIKNKILDEDFNILAFLIENNNKNKKEIVFQVIYMDKIFIAVTDKDFIKLIPFSFLDEEKLSLTNSVEQIPYVFEKTLENEETERIFIFSEKHKCGACQCVFIDPEKKALPSKPLFYFYIVRIKKNKVVKIHVCMADCPLTANSQQIT